LIQTNKFSDVSASFRAIFSVSKFKKFLLGSTRPDSTKASPHCQLRSCTSYHCPMILKVQSGESIRSVKNIQHSSNVELTFYRCFSVSGIMLKKKKDLLNNLFNSIHERRTKSTDFLPFAVLYLTKSTTTYFVSALRSMFIQHN